MDKRKLLDHAEPIESLYQIIENRMLLEIATILSTGNGLIDLVEGGAEYAPHWRIEKLNQLPQLNSNNIRMIAEHSRKTEKQVRKQLEVAGFKAVDDIEHAFKPNPNVPSPRNSSSLYQVIDGYTSQATKSLNMVNATMINSIGQKYLDTINIAVAGVIAGNDNLAQTMQKVVDNIGSGATALIDKQGNRWKPDVYANTIIRSTISNTANSMQDARFDEYGVDLVQVTAHGGARPLCAPYQGRIYSRSGGHPRYPDLGSTSMGQAAGLFGINCGHFKFPYYEGMSPIVSKETLSDINENNDELYKQMQYQRSLENKIRQSKREHAIAQKLGYQEEIDKANARTRKLQEDTRQFTEATGLRRRYDREKLY